MNSRDHAFEGARPGTHEDTAVPRGNTPVGDLTVGARSVATTEQAIPPGYAVPTGPFVGGRPASVTPPTGSDTDRAVSVRFASGEHGRAGDGHDDHHT